MDYKRNKGFMLNITSSNYQGNSVSNIPCTTGSQLVKNKKCVIIGGASGMGECISRELAKEGASVVTISRISPEEERAKNVIRACQELSRNGKFKHIQCNVTNKCATEKAIAEAAEFLGGNIDLLLCGAGSSNIGPTATMPSEQFEDDMANNFYATVYPCQAAFPYMKAKGGVILTCSATAAYHPMKQYAAYSSAKAAVQAFTRIIAVEWGEYNIRANCLVGLTFTPFTAENPALLDPEIKAQAEATTLKDIVLSPELSPWDRVRSTQEIADYVVFLASDKASYITAQSISIDGGSTASRF